MTTLTLGRALNEGLRRTLADDPRVLVMGEDVGALGGVYRVTDGLQAEFGADRVIDTPLAESAIVGTAIGLAMRGYRPVCEIQFDGFVFPAFDQIVSQLARMRSRTRGKVALPVTIRIPVGGGIGAAEHHSESPEAYFAHTPGLRVVTVANPQDAYTCLRQSIASDDPVIFFEPKRRYHAKGEVDLEAPLSAAPPLDGARVLTMGDDVTLVTFGALVPTALDVAAVAADEGTGVEVIDLRSLSPLDVDTVAASVRRTGRVVIAHEAPRSGGLGAELAASITEACFAYLETAPVRVTGHDIPYPPARAEQHHLPDLDRILDGVDRALGRTPVEAAP
jgi:Pyruvate/2-oxoglutarate dehydrogenase complex, dehydrogenase (E1) component, eukaryotic type, beta subunit